MTDEEYKQAYESGYKAGNDHRKPSTDMEKRLSLIEKDFKDHEDQQTKSVDLIFRWFVGSAITVVGGILAIGVFIGTTNLRSEECRINLEKQEVRIDSLSERIREAEIDYEGLSRDLKNISDSLLEIKEALKINGT